MVRKLIVAIGIFTGMTTAASAQYVSFGPALGFGHSTVMQGDYKDVTPGKAKFNPSFSAGLSLIYAKHEHWGFGLDVIYSQEGYKKNVSTNNGRIDFDEKNTVGYIRLPLKAYYFFGQYKDKVRPKVFLGPSIGIKVMEDGERTANNNLTRELFSGTGAADVPAYNTVDLGLQAGAGVNITLGPKAWLNLDISYYHGLLDAMKDKPNVETGYNMNQNLRFNAGVLFALGKPARKG
jgi:outer membrane protein W